MPCSEPINLCLELAKKNCNTVLWECGPSLASLAIKQGCVQELAVVVSPKLLGGLAAKTPLSELGFNSMEQVINLKSSSMSQLGEDLLLEVSTT